MSDEGRAAAGVNAFTLHLDECARCRDHPMALCDRGRGLIVQAVEDLGKLGSLSALSAALGHFTRSTPPPPAHAVVVSLRPFRAEAQVAAALIAERGYGSTNNLDELHALVELAQKHELKITFVRQDERGAVTYTLTEMQAALSRDCEVRPC